MYLNSVSLLNFRPYKDTSIEFTSEKGHINVIEGQQGAGKTSFQKAIKWALYGDTGTTNYRNHWNRSANDRKDERMEVRLKFTSDNNDYQLNRSIKRFDHTNERAEDEVELIIDGVGVRTGDDARETIESILPNELKQFYFLDGERIQNYITGVDTVTDDVQQEIERVLDHQPILNAETDLEDKLSEYKKQRDKIEQEVSERDSLTEEIQQLRNELNDYRNELENKKDYQDELSDELERLNKEAAEQNEEIVEKIREIDEKISKEESNKRDKYEELQDIVDNLHIIEVSDRLNKVSDELGKKIDSIEEELTKKQRHQIIHELINKAKDDSCPICGNKKFKNSKFESPDILTDDEIRSLESRKEDLSRMAQNLSSESPPNNIPKEIQSEIQQIQNRIDSLEEEQSLLIDDLKGLDDPQKHRDLSQEMERKRARLSELTKDIGSLEEKIESLKNDINKKERKRNKKYENKDLEILKDKIEAAKAAMEKYKNIRKEHIQRKREDIRSAMSDVFDQVTQSKFVSSKYNGLEFRGEIGDDDAFSIEMIRFDETNKKMEWHSPSAGESQLAALSFVFGLNKYASYESTIVFDTVAGRLDKENARAEGELFTKLDHPIILLVTDAELEALRHSIEKDIGSYHQITLDNNKNSVFKEIER